MGLREKTSIVVRAKGVSDARDGTNAFPGAMVSLQNLVLSYHTDGVFVPRPAGVKVIDFTNFIPTMLNINGNTTSGANTIALLDTALDLNFITGVYQAEGVTYPLAALPGYSYTRTGALTVLDAINNFDTFAAGVPPINTLGYQSYGATTNPVLQSRGFDSASWSKPGGAVTANATAAPDGSTTADEFIEDTSTGSHGTLQSNATGVLTASTWYTASIFVKRAAGTRNVQLKLADGSGSNGVSATFNLGTGTVSVAAAAFGTGWTAGAASIIAFSNGWYLVSVPFQGAAVNANFDVFAASGTSTSYTGDGASALYLWQAQVIQGLPVGSIVIPTTTAGVTTGVPAFSATVANGTYTATYTFDDNSTQTMSVTVSGGVFTLATFPTLNRPIVKHLQVTAPATSTSVLTNFTVSGAGIPAGAVVTGVAGGTVTISTNATATGSMVPLVFASPPNPNGVISEMIPVGTRVYGMVSSAQYLGKDEPFCYDLSTNQFVSIRGVQSALLPVTQNATGDWTPPVMRAVNNTYLLCTHPGFAGGAVPGVYFGWIDISSYAENVIGNTTTGSNVISSLYTTIGNSSPILQGVQPGQLIINGNFPTGTYVVSCADGTFDSNTTGDTTSGSNSIANVANIVGIAMGMTVSGPGIASGIYVTNVSGTTVTISANATATATGVALNFSGGGSITVSANATASASVVTVGIAGGTPAAPLWGAGNFNTNPITTIPKAVYGFNSRAYMGSGPYLIYSDPLMPLQVSAASQALLVGDGTDITALAGVPLSSQYTGGIQQSMTVFKGAGTLYQVTGDAGANDFAVNGTSYDVTGGSGSDSFAINAVNGSVGTLAPRSIVGTPNGTLFMAVDGLRLLSLYGFLSEPLNVDGKGVAIPFLNALYPSRIVAAYSQNIYRVTVQDGSQPGDPMSEYWFDINDKVWTGPHTIPTRAAQGYSAAASFLVAPFTPNGQIWQSDAIPNFSSSYSENGVRLQCAYETTLLPDNQETRWNKVVQGTLVMSLSNADYANVQVTDDRGGVLGACSFNGAAASASVWDSFVWGSGTWGAPTSLFREYFLGFPNSLVFRQAHVSVTFQAAQGQQIGNLYVPVQPVNMNDV